MSNVAGPVSSSAMISLQRSMHSSQMYTPGPAISFLTCRCDFPQKLQRSCSFESVGRAMPLLPDEAQEITLMMRDHPIDQVVVLSLFGTHKVVAFGVSGYLFELLLGALGKDLVEAAAHVDDLLGVDLDIRRLPLEARGDLVDEDLGVGQRHALAVSAAGQEQGAHRHRDAYADRLDLRLDELHRVVDREARVHGTARRVDVDRDVLVRVLGLEVKELRDDEVGDLVGDRRSEEHDSLVEQTGVDVECALSARSLLDDHGDKGAHGSRFVCLARTESFRPR